jgi:hypothetical protein
MSSAGEGGPVFRESAGRCAMFIGIAQPFAFFGTIYAGQPTYPEQK